MPLFRSLFLSAVLAAPAFAAPSHYTDGPHAGLPFGGDTVDPSLQVGWQAAYDFSPAFSLQLSYGYHSDYIPPENLAGIGLPAGSAVSLGLHTVALTGRWYAWTGDITGLYALGGIQWMTALEDSGQVDVAIAQTGSPIRDFSVIMQKEFGLHAGLGGEVSLSKHWEVFTEYRHVWHQAGLGYTLVTEDPQGGRHAAEIDGDLSYDQDLLRLGVNYRF